MKYIYIYMYLFALVSADVGCISVCGHPFGASLSSRTYSYTAARRAPAPAAPLRAVDNARVTQLDSFLPSKCIPRLALAVLMTAYK